MIVSFCEINFIMRHFKLLKTVIGKGMFNIFCASMFLVGNQDSLWGWLMFGGLLGCGLFFILIGCACISSYDDKDITKDDLLKNKSETAEADPAKESLV